MYLLRVSAPAVNERTGGHFLVIQGAYAVPQLFSLRKPLRKGRSQEVTRSHNNQSWELRV